MTKFFKAEKYHKIRNSAVFLNRDMGFPHTWAWVSGLGPSPPQHTSCSVKHEFHWQHRKSPLRSTCCIIVWNSVSRFKIYALILCFKSRGKQHKMTFQCKKKKKWNGFFYSMRTKKYFKMHKIFSCIFHTQPIFLKLSYLFLSSWAVKWPIFWL